MLNTNLLWMPDGTELVADAAESWELSSDGMVWTFVLKDNVRFQTGYEPTHARDGTILVAADVAYSMRKIMGLEDGVVSARSGWIKEFVDTARPDGGLETVDDRTVKFHMRAPLAALGDVMAILFSGIYPENVTREMLQTRPYGAGPFKLKEFQRGALWQYAANPDYFKPGYPYLDEIHHVNIRGTEVSQSALITNQIDMTGGLPTLDNESIYNRMQDEGKIVVRPYTTSCRPQGVNMNSTAPPFDDLRLRQAVHLAINREDYIAVVHRAPDRAVPALVLDTNGIWGRTSDEIWAMEGYARGDAKAAEIAQAKAIVDELFPGGLDVDMMVRDSSTYQRQGEFIAGELAKVGIRANLNIMNSAQLFPAAEALNYSIWAYYFCQTTLTPEEMYGSYFVTGGSRNWLGYGEADLDAKFFEMAATADFAARHALGQEIEDMIIEDLPYAPLAVQNGARVYWSYIQDVPIPVGLQYMWPKRERIWRNDV
jgi:peptide/nickel transport system substrate-binding protein